MAETVRIDPGSHAALVEIAHAKRIALSEALRRAVDAYRREVFLEAMATGYAAIRTDERAWVEEEAERGAWDATVADGLEPR